MTPQHVSLLTIPVDNLSEAIDFYGRALDWEVGNRFADDIAFFQLPGFVAALWDRAGWEDEGLGIDPPGYMTFAINFSRPPEVDEAVARFVEAGGTAMTEPSTVYWGGYSSYVRDPWGNLIEFAVNDALEVTPDGETRLR